MWKRLNGNEQQLEGQILDLSPEIHLAQQRETKGEVDRAELLRSKWFWDRRPEKIASLQNAKKAILCSIGFYLCAFLVYQQILATSVRGMITCVFFASLLVAYVHIVRYAQWKLEYRRAIGRLLQKSSR